MLYKEPNRYIALAICMDKPIYNRRNINILDSSMKFMVMQNCRSPFFLGKREKFCVTELFRMKYGKAMRVNCYT